MGFPVTRPHVEIRLVVKKRTEINNCGKVKLRQDVAKYFNSISPQSNTDNKIQK